MSAESAHPQSPDANVHELIPRFITDIADRAHIEPELLRGARVERLHNETIIVNMNDLKDIDGNGLFVVFGLGSVSALKLYKKTNEGGFLLTSGDHSIEDVDDPIVPLNYVEIEVGKHYTHGRETKYRDVLGVGDDPSVSRRQMVIQISNEGDMSLTDYGLTNGLVAFMQEVEKPKLEEVVGEKIWKRLFGRHMVVDDHIQHK